MEALGFYEVRSFVVALEAADAMTKAANVKIYDFNRVGSGLIAVVVSGEVAAVTAAVEAAKSACRPLGHEVAAHVIPRPAKGMEMLFSKGR